MGFNPMEMLQLNSRFTIFGKQHPRVVSFFKENGRELKEGNVVECKIKTKEGKELLTNMRISAEDVETLKMLAKLMKD